jgi:peptide/nickel transport system ATP-binding protein
VGRDDKGVSFDIPENTIVALVGESGSGKSVTAMSVLNLLPDNAERQGQVLWQGRDLLKATMPELQGLRGKEIACVFQDPMSSLNPVFTVGAQLAEPLMRHMGLPKAQAFKRAEELLGEVGIPEPGRRMTAYPHELSGGQQQRVMIAMALSCEPKLLIADEPTTALDVTIQAQILDLMAELKASMGMSVMLITHAMGVVAEVAQRVVVMYAGKVVEEATVEELFAHPRHPYTQGLIRSIPRIDLAATHKVRLEAIPGTVPKLIEPAEGCRFASRCRHASAACLGVTPPLREVAPGHKVACVLEGGAA